MAAWPRSDRRHPPRAWMRVRRFAPSAPSSRPSTSWAARCATFCSAGRSTDFDFTTPLDPDRIETLGARRGPATVPRRQEVRHRRVQGRRAHRRGHDVSLRGRTPSTRAGRASTSSPSSSADLSRRDFTINAMALHGDEVIDLFGGQSRPRRRRHPRGRQPARALQGGPAAHAARRTLRLAARVRRRAATPSRR